MPTRAALVLALLTFAYPANSQSLRMSITTDKHDYQMTENIRLSIELLNNGKKDIYLWTSDLCWNSANGLSMHVRAANGSEVVGTILLDCLPPPPNPENRNPYQFIPFEAETFYGRVDTFKVAELLTEPGEYDIEVTFRSFLSEKWVKQYLTDEPIAKLPLWTIEMPPVRSGKVHISVRR